MSAAQRPRLLDLFCGGGGAAMGYYNAGFDVYGVDLRSGRDYPFPYYRDDALRFLQAHLDDPWQEFDAIHASPPCQAHSALRSLERGYRQRLFSLHEDLVSATRSLLAGTGVPYVIENVPGAPIRADLELCGSHFGLGTTCRDGVYRQLRRHRLFELEGFTVDQPACCHHGPAVGVYGHGGGDPERQVSRGRGYMATTAEARAALGIEWLDMRDLAQAIPPAYTELVGRGLLAAHHARQATGL